MIRWSKAFFFVFVLFPWPGLTQSKSTLLRQISSAKNMNQKHGLMLELADVYDLDNNDSCFILAKQVLKWAHKNKHTSLKADAYEKLGSYYYYRDQPANALPYFKNCVALGQQLKNNEVVSTAYTNLSKVYILLGKTQEAIEANLKSIALDRKSKNLKGLASSTNALAVIYAETGNNLKALPLHHEALQYAKKAKDTSLMGVIYIDLGMANKALGRLKPALEFYQKAVLVAENLNDDDYKIAGLVNMGTVYDDLKLYAKARNCYMQCIDLCTQHKDQMGIAKMYNNIGFIFINQNQPDSALVYFRKAYDIKRDLQNPKSLALTVLNIGQALFQKKQYDSAMTYYQTAFNTYVEVNDSAGIAALYLNFASIALKKKAYKKATDYLKLSLELSKKANYTESMAEGYKSLSDVYNEQGDYKNAYESHVLFYSLRDSILNEKITRQLTEMDAIYESSEKEKKIASLHQQAKIKNAVLAKRDAEAKRKKAWMIVFGSALVFVCLLLVLVVRNNRQKKQANRLLTHQKHVIEEKNKEILDSINYAKRLQDAILPSRKLVRSWLEESFIMYKPKDIVAGDFYWMETVTHTPHQLVLFAAADCTGHGVPGAMVSVVCATALNRSVKEFKLTTPADILNKTRELVIETFERSENEVKDGMDISLCSLNTVTRELQWAGANNPLWILRKNSAVLEEVQGDRQPVGKHVNPVNFTPHTIRLEPGDTIYIFTDGYADQFGGEKGKKLKLSNLKKIILDTGTAAMAKQLYHLEECFEQWRGGFEQLDDVCVIGIRV